MVKRQANSCGEGPDGVPADKEAHLRGLWSSGWMDGQGSAHAGGLPSTCPIALQATTQGDVPGDTAHVLTRGLLPASGTVLSPSLLNGRRRA